MLGHNPRQTYQIKILFVAPVATSVRSQFSVERWTWTRLPQKDQKAITRQKTRGFYRGQRMILWIHGTLSWAFISNQALFHTVLKCTSTYKTTPGAVTVSIKSIWAKTRQIRQINEAFTFQRYTSERLIFFLLVTQNGEKAAELSFCSAAFCYIWRDIHGGKSWLKCELNHFFYIMLFIMSAASLQSLVKPANQI